MRREADSSQSTATDGPTVWTEGKSLGSTVDHAWPKFKSTLQLVRAAAA